jgi:acyl carrier protein
MTLDLDSMHFLRLIEALHEKTGVDVPEADYPRLDSLDGAAAYLAQRLGAAYLAQRLGAAQDGA